MSCPLCYLGLRLKSTTFSFLAVATSVTRLRDVMPGCPPRLLSGGRMPALASSQSIFPSASMVIF